jgi:hypothetical protein
MVQKCQALQGAIFSRINWSENRPAGQARKLRWGLSNFHDRLRQPVAAPAGLNEIWALDFIAGAL